MFLPEIWSNKELLSVYLRTNLPGTLTRKINRMIEMYNEQKNTVAEICKIYNISRPSFYNYLNNRKRKLAKGE